MLVSFSLVFKVLFSCDRTKNYEIIAAARLEGIFFILLFVDCEDVGPVIFGPNKALQT